MPERSEKGRAGSARRRRNAARCAHLPIVLGLLTLVIAGCENTTVVDLRREINTLNETAKTKDNQVVAQQATITELHKQLDTARSINEDDLKRVFYPEKLEIDKLTGGADYDGKLGDDGVTVYLRPIDHDGDVIKVAGDIRIQLYDLANAPGKNFVGEYFIPVDQVGKLWNGKLWTNHYTIKCPWPKGPPQHTEITVRATFVDYLTKRVVSAQATCQVKLPPD